MQTAYLHQQCSRRYWVSVLLFFFSSNILSEESLPGVPADMGYSSQIFQQQQAKLNHARDIIKQYHSCIEFFDVNDGVARLIAMLGEHDDILAKRPKLTNPKMRKVLGQSKAITTSRLEGLRSIIAGVDMRNLRCPAAVRLEKEFQLNTESKPQSLPDGQYSRQQYQLVLQTLQQHMEVQFEVINQLQDK